MVVKGCWPMAALAIPILASNFCLILAGSISFCIKRKGNLNSFPQPPFLHLLYVHFLICWQYVLIFAFIGLVDPEDLLLYWK